MEILILVLLVSSVVICFLSATVASVISFVALLLTYFAGGAVSSASLIFWAVATAIVVALRFMLPAQVNSHREGSVYITAGGVAGLFIGIALSPAATPAAIIVATILGALAYATTPSGRALLGFPSRKAVNYLCAKGLPVIVALTMLVTSFISLRHFPAL